MFVAGITDYHRGVLGPASADSNRCQGGMLLPVEPRARPLGYPGFLQSTVSQTNEGSLAQQAHDLVAFLRVSRTSYCAV